MGRHQPETWSTLLAGRTVAPTVTVHLRDRYFSFAGKDLFLPCAFGKTAASTKRRKVPCPRGSRQISDDLNVSSHHPVYIDVDL
jgi:hypothetical protein